MNVNGIYQEALKEYNRSPYPPIIERKKNLSQLKKCLQKESREIVEAIDKDFQGRSKTETALLELFPSIQAIKHSIKHTRKWSKSKRRWLGPWLMPASARIMPQPKGVVGFVVPWNYPLYLTISPLANALSAGNVVLIKLSEQSMHLGELLKALIIKYNITRIKIVTGDVEVAKLFCELPFDHVLYTGSGHVAKSVLRSASKNLTPVTLELGGKSPVIVGRNVKKSLYERIIVGKCFNAGQTCVAPDYIFLPRDKKNEFLVSAQKIFQKLYPKFKTNNDYSALISEQHLTRLDALLKDAIDKGAESISLATRDDSTKVMPLNLLFNVHDDMAILQEEIFGPLLPIILYDDFEDVIAHIKANGRPLAIYYFGQDRQEMNRIKKDTHSGSITINDTLIQAAADNLPFGGIGESGMGQYHGKDGFETFSKMKPIFRQSRCSSFSILYPPYGRLVRMFLKTVAGIK